MKLRINEVEDQAHVEECFCVRTVSIDRLHD